MKASDLGILDTISSDDRVKALYADLVDVRERVSSLERLSGRLAENGLKDAYRIAELVKQNDSILVFLLRVIASLPTGEVRSTLEGELRKLRQP